MTAEEFEAAYAQRAGVSVEWLHQHGRYAEPCDCGEPECEGWAMGHPWEDAIVEGQLRTTLPPGSVQAGDRIRLHASGVIPSSHATLTEGPPPP